MVNSTAMNKINILHLINICMNEPNFESERDIRYDNPDRATYTINKPRQTK